MIDDDAGRTLASASSVEVRGRLVDETCDLLGLTIFVKGALRFGKH